MASQRLACHVYIFCLAMAASMAQAAGDQQTAYTEGPTILIDPRSFSTEERRLIREGVTRALDFFAASGIDLKAPVHVQAQSRDFSGHIAHIGSYGQNTITIDSLDASLGRKGDYRLFRLPIDDALYSSIATHEVAHAIADQNFTLATPSLVAHAY